MNYVEMQVGSHGTGMSEAVAATEKMGLDAGLSKKEALRLRLLAEELLGMIRGITGDEDEDFKADYRAQQEGKSYSLILEGEIVYTKEIRKALLAVSSTGENAAAKGFMGKIKDMIATSFLPKEDGTNGLAGISVGLMSLGSPTGYGSDDNMTWSMRQYVDGIRNTAGEEAKEAWDELEKSITASIADDVSVSIKGTKVTISVSKTF